MKRVLLALMLAGATWSEHARAQEAPSAPATTATDEAKAAPPHAAEPDPGGAPADVPAADAPSGEVAEVAAAADPAPTAPPASPVVVSTPAPAVSAGQPPWQQPAWRRYIILAGLTAAPTFALAAMLPLSFAAMMLGGVAFMSVLPATPPLYMFAVPATVAVAATLAIGALFLAPIYVVARAVLPWLVPMPGLETPRVVRGFTFNVMDAVVHAAGGAGALVFGFAGSAVVTAFLFVGALFMPYALCLPFCLPIGSVYGRDANQGLAAFYGLTAAPITCAVMTWGLCGAVVAGSQGLVPLLALGAMEGLGREDADAPVPLRAWRRVTGLLGAGTDADEEAEIHDDAPNAGHRNRDELDDSEERTP